MSLNDVCAKLSMSGLPTIQLLHGPSQSVIQVLRLAKASSTHRNFILGTWVKSYRPTARKLGIGEFYDRHEPAIAESRWQDCWVATDEDGYTVYAWVCGETSEGNGNLYHVYVIPELRHKRVAMALQQHACNSLHPDMARPFPTRGSTGHVNPYLLHCKEPQQDDGTS